MTDTNGVQKEVVISPPPQTIQVDVGNALINPENLNALIENEKQSGSSLKTLSRVSWWKEPIMEKSILKRIVVINSHVKINIIFPKILFSKPVRKSLPHSFISNQSLNGMI